MPPPYYKAQLTNQQQYIVQCTRSATDYIAHFDDLIFHCGISEDPTITLSHFQTQLSEYVIDEIFSRDICTLYKASQVVIDLNSFHIPFPHTLAQSSQFSVHTSLNPQLALEVCESLLLIRSQQDLLMHEALKRVNIHRKSDKIIHLE